MIDIAGDREILEAQAFAAAFRRHKQEHP
jgi:hypothetical protein